MKNVNNSSYAQICREYIDKYKDYELSNQKLAKKILKENPNLDTNKDNLRIVIGALKRSDNNTGVQQACEENGVSPNSVPYLWLKSEGASLMVRNPEYKQEDYNQFKEDIIESIKGHEPNYPTIVREQSKDGHLLVIDPADVHIGKLADAFETGDNYDTNIAVQRVKEGVQGILDKAYGFNIDKILFIGGNDILHIDTPRRTTTSGTPQDTDGMWYRNFLDAKQLYVS
jgi:hypothetical protein